ncbi:MAG: hypothetical protein J6X70_05925 [Muribaculaceae bacterium]|nr:hypothetical protein [Muribaculaceae bacterium]
MKLRQRNNLLITLVALIAIAVVAIAAWRSPRGQQWVAEWRGDTLATSSVDSSAVDTVPPVDYEYGKPVEDLQAQEVVPVDTAEADTVPQRNQIEQMVFETQTAYDELCAVHAKWEQRPSRSLRRRGLELRNDVLTKVGLLMPLARKYNYKRGIRMASEIRASALAMKFD